MTTTITDRSELDRLAARRAWTVTRMTTPTGRLSNSEPNLQNIPVETDAKYRRKSRAGASSFARTRDLSMNTIKARVTVTTTTTTRVTRALPVVDPEDLDDFDAGMAEKLFAADVDREDEVAMLARSLPEGCAARKPTGEVRYTRVRSGAWLFKTLGIPDETRVLAMSPDGGVSLWNPDDIVVVKLSDVAPEWLLHELDELHCPK